MDKNKPRLADVTKKNTTDRASKLAGSFLPPAPAVASVPPQAEPTPEPAPALQEAMPSEVEQSSVNTNEQPGVSAEVASPPTTVPKAKERQRRSGSVTDIIDVVNQPVPEGLRCTRMIMVCDEHHDLLRELSFKFKKPMTALLYNLLETANQAFEREKQKGGQ